MISEGKEYIGVDKYLYSLNDKDLSLYADEFHSFDKIEFIRHCRYINLRDLSLEQYKKYCQCAYKINCTERYNLCMKILSLSSKFLNDKIMINIVKDINSEVNSGTIVNRYKYLNRTTLDNNLEMYMKNLSEVELGFISDLLFQSNSIFFIEDCEKIIKYKIGLDEYISNYPDVILEQVKQRYDLCNRIISSSKLYLKRLMVVNAIYNIEKGLPIDTVLIEANVAKIETLHNYIHNFLIGLKGNDLQFFTDKLFYFKGFSCINDCKQIVKYTLNYEQFKKFKGGECIELFELYTKIINESVKMNALCEAFKKENEKYSQQIPGCRLYTRKKFRYTD